MPRVLGTALLSVFPLAIVAAAAVDVAYWQALAAGQEVLVSGEGGIYRALPNGTHKLVKAIAASPLSVSVGTRVKIS